MQAHNWISMACLVCSQLDSKQVRVCVRIKYDLKFFLQGEAFSTMGSVLCQAVGWGGSLGAAPTQPHAPCWAVLAALWCSAWAPPGQSLIPSICLTSQIPELRSVFLTALKGDRHILTKRDYLKSSLLP